MTAKKEEAKAVALARLDAMGRKDVSEKLLDINLSRAEAELLADINRSQIPKGLLYVWADMAVGHTLLSQLSDENADPNATSAVTSVKEGDTSVSFDVSLSSVALLKAEAERMARPPASVIARYRRLSW